MSTFGGLIVRDLDDASGLNKSRYGWQRCHLLPLHGWHDYSKTLYASADTESLETEPFQVLVRCHDMKKASLPVTNSATAHLSHACYVLLISPPPHLLLAKAILRESPTEIADPAFNPDSPENIDPKHIVLVSSFLSPLKSLIDESRCYDLALAESQAFTPQSNGSLFEA